MSATSTCNRLIFAPHAAVRYGGNVFVNVPVILQVDGTPLIETIRNNEISRTTQISIFNADGAFLATVVGTCLSPTAEGVRAGIELRFASRLTSCSLLKQVLFEVRRVAAASLTITAELFSPTGLLVRATDLIPFATYTREGELIATAAGRNRRIRTKAVGFAVSDKGKTILLGGEA